MSKESHKGGRGSPYASSVHYRTIVEGDKVGGKKKQKHSHTRCNVYYRGIYKIRNEFLHCLKNGGGWDSLRENRLIRRLWNNEKMAQSLLVQHK